MAIVKTDQLSRAVWRVNGHFGEWMQGRLSESGPIVLVTMGCDVLYAEASYWTSDVLKLRNYSSSIKRHMPVTEAQLRRLLRAGSAVEGGAFDLLCTMPIGVGAGASTAALVALARAAECPEDEIATACLAAEGASDPLMFEHPDRMLWASRQAKCVEEFDAPPCFDVVGGYFGEPIQTDPADSDFPDIADLVLAWRNATRSQNTQELAEIASESARRTTAMRGPNNDPTAQIAQDLGALGYARAHTGSARALLFSPNAIPKNAIEYAGYGGLVRAFQFTTGHTK